MTVKTCENLTEKYLIEVNGTDRWEVYQRLNELDIPCCCQANQPLQVEIANPLSLVQFWFVTHRLTASRQELIQTLEHSWCSHYQR